MLAKATKALVAATALASIWAAPAAANTIDVFPGESIQAAVHRAHPGDVIVVHSGVYRESVQVKKNDLKLIGAGSTGDSRTVIEHHHPAGKHCGHGGAGICILPHKNDQGDEVATHDTRVKGFRIRDFHDAGAIAIGARNTVFRHNAFVGNDEYGAAAFGSHSTRFLFNRAAGADEAGIYVGDSPHAHAHVRGNRASRNGSFGVFLRDAAGGVVTDNRARNNCVGIGLVNTDSKGRAHGWTVEQNRVVKNNSFCKGEEGGPPVSGTGIWLLGANHNDVDHNHVLRNRPARPAAFGPGGIVLQSSVPLGGTPAEGNRIAHNRAFHNKPDDIFWDGDGSGNQFAGNHCDTSDPNGLCQ